MDQTFLPQKCDNNVMPESIKSTLYPPALPIAHFDFNDPKYKYKYRSSSSNEEEGDPMDRDDSFSEFRSNGDGTFAKRYPGVAKGCNRYELGVIEQYEILVGNCFGPDELVMLRELMEKYPPGVIKSGIRHLATKYGEAFAEQGFAYCYEPIMKGAFGSERKKRGTGRKKTRAHDPRNSGGQGTGLEDYGDMKRKVATRIAKDG
jgi:hypothetical protein